MKSHNNQNNSNFYYPSFPILYLTENDIKEIPPEEINIDKVGVKAFGLSCLPQLWTLPFIVISDDIQSQFKKCLSENREKMLKQWSVKILLAALHFGFKESDHIIIRSSGCTEDLTERGKFYSVPGILSNLIQSLSLCLSKIEIDCEINKQKIPLILQKYLVPISEKGHLSNERRFYEEKRDWVGEFEANGKPFKINLRNWREKINIIDYKENILKCKLIAHISEVLKIPATWAYELDLRIHFEWVWDGNNIYIVQADQEKSLDGEDPTENKPNRFLRISEFKPKCLVQVTEIHASRYNKIRNVFIYKKLKLSTVPLYILDNQDTIKKLSKGIIQKSLKYDISELIKGSLVIRIDIATEDYNKRQLLPRTEEVRELNSALNWLIEKSAKLLESEIKEDIAFIFHNFIPAKASAFAYATPKVRKVPIEALWGIPEGLYYNTHDQYVVDTIAIEIDELQKLDNKKIHINETRNYKRFFISPDENGRWISKIIKPPYDWLGTIQRKEWIVEIAKASRFIAEQEGKPLSIMWFIDVAIDNKENQIIPWYHEYYDSVLFNRAPTKRTKTPFDKSLIIKTNKDIETLKQEAQNQQYSIRRILIQPSEDKLLRDKDTLRIIGELARKINAIIFLEGGILSHAYYQLLQTKARVEVAHPFGSKEDKHEYNKLVRDKIPYNIENGGEIVHVGKLADESLLKALREKLVEEAFEVLDAIDQESIISELADVNEIIEGILSHLHVNRKELKIKQKQKRERAGGFEDGIILLETQNPLPIEKKSKEDGFLFDDFDEMEKRELNISEADFINLSHRIEKWSDKRDHPASTEELIHLVFPIVLDKWNISTSPISIDTTDYETGIQARISGKRLGCKYQIELSLYTNYKQLKLFKFIKQDDVSKDI